MSSRRKLLELPRRAENFGPDRSASDEITLQGQKTFFFFAPAAPNNFLILQLTLSTMYQKNWVFFIFQGCFSFFRGVVKGKMFFRGIFFRGVVN